MGSFVSVFSEQEFSSESKKVLNINDTCNKWDVKKSGP